MKYAFIFILSFSSIFCEAQNNNVLEFGSNPSAGKYIDVNDIKMYYEVYGKGEPLLLLHGGAGSIHDFFYQIPELSKHYKVIAIDSRGQGRTTDSDKQITYAQMAADVAAFIDKLQLGSVYVLGWSDGGNDGLELAYAFPDKVKKLITCGANYTHENWVANKDTITMKNNDPLLLKTKEFLAYRKSGYDTVNQAIKNKLNNLWKNYPNFTPDQLKTIKTPTLVIAGDHDIVNIDLTVTLYKSLPNAELFIVPHASHLLLVEQPEILNSIILKFLETPFRKLDNFYIFRKN